MRFVVGPIAEIPVGQRRIVYPFGPPGVAIFNLNGEFAALKNVCPHQGAPLCSGVITGTSEARTSAGDLLDVEWVREGEIITCPWHHWEFEIKTGRTVFPSRNKVATYAVYVEHDEDDEDDIERRILQGAQSYPVVVEAGIIVVELPDR
jgi:nitrite reductase (NADH) small subunit